MLPTLERVRAEFLEMPGLRLTIEQVHRLCGVERRMCSAALDTLVQERFLCLKADGTYARFTDGSPRPRPAKADLETQAASDARASSGRERRAKSRSRTSTR